MTDRPQSPARAIIYLRVSTAVQVRDGSSLDTQEAACLKKAAELGAAVVRIVRDEGVSGGLLLARPGIREALRRIESGEADLLICSELSRFTRDLEHQQQLIRRLKAAGARLVLCSGETGDSAEAEFALDIQGAVNKLEKRKIRERTQAGRRQFAVNGTQVYRRFSPWGYHIPTKADVMRHLYTVTQLGKYLVIEEQAVMVRELFERCAQGHSLGKLTAWLNDTGVPTRNGAAQWSRVTIRAIVINPVYKGTALFGRREAIFSEERTASHPRGKPQYTLRPRDEADCVPIDAPAIVTPEIWEAANARLRENQKRLSGNPGRRVLLSGMVICPECGYRMRAPNTSSGRYYRCDNNRPNCSNRKVERAERIEGAVIRAIGEMVRRPEIIRAAIESHHAREQSAPAINVGDVSRELAALERRTRIAVQAQIAGVAAGAPPEAYNHEFQAIAARKAVLQEQLDIEARSRFQSSAPGSPDILETFRSAAASVEEVLLSPDLSPAEQNEALRMLIHSIHIEQSGRYRICLGEARNTRVTVNQTFPCFTVSADPAFAIHAA